MNANEEDLSVTAWVTIRFMIENYCLWNRDMESDPRNFRRSVIELLEEEGVSLGGDELEIISVEPIIEE